MAKKIYLIISLLTVITAQTCGFITGPEDSQLHLLWKKELPVESTIAFPSGIAIDGNTLYFADDYSKMYMINTDGSGFKEAHLPNGSTFGVPVIWGNLVVVGTSNAGPIVRYAGIYAFNKLTLETMWAKTHFIWTGVPAIDEMYVYATDLDKVYAFDKTSGRQVWSQTIFGKNVYNPVIEGGRLYFATGSIFKRDGYLYCLDKYNGEIVFQDTLPYMPDRSQFGGSPAGVEIWRDYVYVPADNRNLYCFNKHTGALVWKFLADAPMETPPRLSEGIVYTGSLNRTVYAINAKTGVPLWSYQARASIGSNAPQFYKNYVLLEDQNILIFDKKSGKLIVKGGSAFSAVWNMDGQIFAGGYKGDKSYIFAYQF